MKNNEESSEKSAYLYAVKLLAKQDYSKYKITKKLESRGYDSSHIEQTIDKIVELGYLREENYSISRIQAHMNKGFHPDYIQKKLKEEFVEVELTLIKEVFHEYSMTTDKQIEKLFFRKNLNRSEYLGYELEKRSKFEQKLFRYALSKGHQFEDIQKIFSEIIHSSQ